MPGKGSDVDLREAKIHIRSGVIVSIYAGSCPDVEAPAIEVLGLDEGYDITLKEGPKKHFDNINDVPGVLGLSPRSHLGAQITEAIGSIEYKILDSIKCT